MHQRPQLPPPKVLYARIVTDQGDHGQRPGESRSRRRRGRALSEHNLEPLGVSAREYSVLEVLAEHSGARPHDDPEARRLTRAQGARVRERDEHDRRAYAVSLTPEGDRIRSRAFTLLADCEERFLMPLAGDQRHQLNDMLSRIVDL